MRRQGEILRQGEDRKAKGDKEMQRYRDGMKAEVDVRQGWFWGCLQGGGKILQLHYDIK